MKHSDLISTGLQKQIQDDKEKKLEEFVKNFKENKIHYNEYAGSILKSHEVGQNSVYMLIENSLNAQRSAMKFKLEQRKKAHLRRLHPDRFSPEKIKESARARRKSFIVIILSTLTLL